MTVCDSSSRGSWYIELSRLFRRYGAEEVMVMSRPQGDGDAALVEGDVRFADRDAELLRAIAKTGSVNEASKHLTRSHAHALRRIETLEAAFGALVERQRGGPGGGGSRLTENGRGLLDRYDRLSAAITATTQLEETVLHGTVTRVSGVIAIVDTPVGTVRGIHDGVNSDDGVQVRVASDALTLHTQTDDRLPDTTSARNRCRGSVIDLETVDPLCTVDIETGDVTFHATITVDSLSRMDLSEGDQVAFTWKASATRCVRTN